MPLVELTARRIPAVVLLVGTLAMLLVALALVLALHMDLIPRHTAMDTAILHTGLHPTDVFISRHACMYISAVCFAV